MRRRRRGIPGQQLSLFDQPELERWRQQARIVDVAAHRARCRAAPVEPGALLTTADVGKLLQLTRWGVHWLVKSGALEARRTVSGQRVYRYVDVVELRKKRDRRTLRPTPPITQQVLSTPLRIVRKKGRVA